MPKEIQNPATSYGLVDATGVKGRFAVALDEVGVPTFEVLNLEKSPYTRGSIPCGGTRFQGGGVGVYSGVGVQPGAGTILEVQQIVVAPNTTQRFYISWLDGIEIGLWTLVSGINLMNLSVQDPQVTAVSPYRPIVQSVVRCFQRNLAPTNTLVPLQCSTNQTYVIDLHSPLFLDGDAALGPPCLMVHVDAVNTFVEAGFYGREWKPRG